MKKIIALLMSGLVLLSLSGCGMGGRGTSPAPETGAGREDADVPAADVQQEDMDVSEEKSETGSEAGSAGSNILIAYFSVSEDVSTDGVDAVAGASIVVRDGEKLGNTEYVAEADPGDHRRGSVPH